MKTTDRYKNALAGMIDHAQLMSRSGWAKQLHVSEAAITYWVQEENVPKPLRLKKIIEQIENSGNEVALQYLDHFIGILDEPIDAVSNIPGKFRHANTISEYLLAPNQEQLRKTTLSLPHVVRQRVLEMTQELVANCYSEIHFEGKSVSEVLESLYRYESVEYENETIMEIFATFYVLLVKVEPDQPVKDKKALLKNLLSQQNLIESGATGAILELDEPDKMVNPFKDVEDLKRILEKKHAKVC